MNCNMCSIGTIVSTLAFASLLGACTGTTPRQPTETPVQASAQQSHPVLADGLAVRNDVDCKPNCYR